MEPEGSFPSSQQPLFFLKLNHLNQVYYLLFYLFKINFNITLPSKPRSPKWSVSFIFLHRNPACISPHPARAIRPDHC